MQTNDFGNKLFVSNRTPAGKKFWSNFNP